MFDPGIMISLLPTLLNGTGTTLAVATLAIALGMPCGLALCFTRQSGPRIPASIAAFYISFFRGTPLLAQLLMFFYLPPAFGLEMPSYPTAVLVLTLNTAAFQAEIFRGGLATIPAGQIEAARVLGLSNAAIRLRVLAPQMLRDTLPALTNEAVDILKNTSLVSVIAVSELLRRAKQAAAATYHPLEAYAMAAVIYLVMVSVLAFLGRRVSRRLSLSR